VSPSARPNAWAGNRVLPRARQHLDAVLALYRIPPDDEMGYTHAWFPASQLDEWTQVGVWTVGRVGAGFVALATEGGARLVTTGPDALQTLRPLGSGRAWVCTVGRRSVHGSIAEFAAALSDPSFAPDEITFHTTAGHHLALSWDGPFLVDGRPVDLGDDGTPHRPPQLDNPYANLAHGDHELVISSPQGVRHRIDLRIGRPVPAATAGRAL
jgi:hypothetical protein